MFDNILAKILLAPFSVLYGAVLSLRNILYETEILKSTRFNIPVISVGNLSLGGTGKTPHIEYLIRLLKDYIVVGTLSRGYKRKTKGFRWVEVRDNALQTGDEPLQFKRKFSHIPVAVSESRDIGIPLMIQKYPEIQTVLLDDAFQHRSVTPGLNILLTEYSNLFVNDYIMPVGRLREPKTAYKRADIIIVSKCPPDLGEEGIDRITKALKPMPYQKLFFSTYKYLAPYFIFDHSITVGLKRPLKVILISAIANTDYLLDYLWDHVEVENIIKYEDHHFFTEFEMNQIKKMYDHLKDEGIVFLTTEKDSVRLELHRAFLMRHRIPIFVLPIEVEFLFNKGPVFDMVIKEFLINFKV